MLTEDQQFDIEKAILDYLDEKQYSETLEKLK